MAGDQWLPAGGRARLYRGHIVWLTKDRARDGWWYGVWQLAKVQDGFIEHGSALQIGPFDTEDQAYRDAVRACRDAAAPAQLVRRLGLAWRRATWWFWRWVRRPRPRSAP